MAQYMFRWITALCHFAVAALVIFGAAKIVAMAFAVLPGDMSPWYWSRFLAVPGSFLVWIMALDVSRAHMASARAHLSTTSDKDI